MFNGVIYAGQTRKNGGRGLEISGWVPGPCNLGQAGGEWVWVWGVIWHLNLKIIYWRGSEKNGNYLIRAPDICCALGHLDAPNSALFFLRKSEKFFHYIVRTKGRDGGPGGWSISRAQEAPSRAIQMKLFRLLLVFIVFSFFFGSYIFRVVDWWVGSAVLSATPVVCAVWYLI